MSLDSAIISLSCQLQVQVAYYPSHKECWKTPMISYMRGSIASAITQEEMTPGTGHMPEVEQDRSVKQQKQASRHFHSSTGQKEKHAQ